MSRAAFVVVPASLFVAVALIGISGCHRTDGDAQTSGEHAGGAIRDAGATVVNGVKTGGEKAGSWVKGVANGVSGDN